MRNARTTVSSRWTPHDPVPGRRRSSSGGDGPSSRRIRHRDARAVACRLATVLLLVGLAASGRPAPAAAQESPSAGFEDAIDVRIVEVDVYVTDRKGRPVRGLGREDFQLFEDGRPVEIVNFARLTTPAAAQEDRVGPLETGDDGPLPTAPESPMTVVLFVDNTTLIQPHRNRVLPDVKEFVDRVVGEGTRFMVVALQPGLEVLAPITADAGTVQAALDEVARMPARGLAARSERRQVIDHMREIHDLYLGSGRDPCVDGWGQMVAAVDTYAQSASHRLGTAQAGLLGLARSLGGLPGRKAVLYLSDGLEQMPGIDLYARLGELCPRREREMFTYLSRWDETRTLEELAAYANAHRVTFYPLETSGLTGYTIASAEYDDRRFAPSARNDTLRISNLQSSLFIMADETGGQAFFNANRPAPELERMARDFTDYYSLGFAPQRGWDGDDHSIRVELAGKAAKGNTLRYRRRYQAVPDEERMAERTLAALMLGWEDNPLDARIELGEPRPGDEEVWEVPVRIEIPAASLDALPAAAGGKRLLRVLMIAEDEKHRRTPMRERVIPLVEGRIAGDSGAVGTGVGGSPDAYSVVVDVELEPGPHAIAIGVRDEIGRLASYRRVTVEVADRP